MASIKMVSTILLAALFMILNQGYAVRLQNYQPQKQQQQCGVSNITVKTSQTGKLVQGAPEWEVIISNQCANCPLKDVYVRCTGFESLEPVERSVFRVDGDECLINGGNPIVSAVPKYFWYAHVTSFDLVPTRAATAC